MKPLRWLNRHTSMRGRLSMMLVALLVVPVLVVGVAYVHDVEKSADAHKSAVQQGVTTGMQAHLEESLDALGVGLDRALLDTAQRLFRAGSSDPAALAARFAELPAARRPTWVGMRRPGGSFDPEPAAFVAEPLRRWTSDGRPHAGYAVLPDLDQPAADALYQVVVEPLPDGGAAVALTILDSRAGGPLDAVPVGSAVVRGLTAHGRPVALARSHNTRDAALVDPAVPASFWETFARGESTGRKRVWLDAHTHVVGEPLPGLDGAPVGVAFVQATAADFYPGGDFLPSAAEPDAAVDSARAESLRSLLGWIALTGVLLALGLGAVAPQWIWSDIRDSTDRIFGSVARLRELVGRNGRALDEQVAAVATLTASVGDLERASASIRDTARALAQSAEQSARVSQSGNHSAETAQRAVLDVRDQVGEINDLMDQLGQRCQEIDGILEFIDQISEGTRKLSINATISAEDPSAAGRQLSYVAAEIRDLAEQALDSTQDIEHRIKEIQRSSSRTITATRSGRREVQRCLESFEELEEAFARILRWVDETTQFARGIESSTATQSDVLGSVSSSVAALERRATETEGNFRDIEDAIDELATLGEEMMHTWKVG